MTDQIRCQYLSLPLLLLLLLLFSSSLRISHVVAFTVQPWERPLRIYPTTSRLHASIVVPGETEEQRRRRSRSVKREAPPEANYWGRKDRKVENNDSQILPCVPSLDAHGELPLGSYSMHGNPSNGPKDTCRISIVLDSEKKRPDDELDFHGTVRSLQQYLDDGFQTFQVKSGPSQHHTVVEEEILGRFLTETPGSVRERCNIMLPLRIPSVQTAPMSPTFVRRNIAASLLRLGSDAVDCIQIQHRERSPYFLDVLDTLEDLKREGLIRSVSVRNSPPMLVREAHANGFEIHSSQLDCNVLDPTKYTTEQKLVCADLGMPLIAANPLAGGLLSDRYCEHMFTPLSTELSVSGNRQLRTTLRTWNQRHANEKGKSMDSWQRFHQKVHPILSHIALKYRVSISTVCLRWILQLQHVSSTAVSYNLFETNAEERSTARRIKSFRNVFRFELDEEDGQALWELSGVEEPPDDFPFSFDNEDDDQEEYDTFEQRNRLYLP